MARLRGPSGPIVTRPHRLTPEQPVSFDRLTWGVKASFRSYVEAAGGTISLSGGATRSGDGSFVFEAVPGGDLAIAADGSATGATRFQGTLNFDAHGGMLKIELTGLGVEAGIDGLVLTALQAPMNKDRCAVAKLGPVEVGADGTLTIRSKITMDGMYQIADNYPPGTELDPVHLV